MITDRECFVLVASPWRPFRCCSSCTAHHESFEYWITSDFQSNKLIAASTPNSKKGQAVDHWNAGKVGAIVRKGTRSLASTICRIMSVEQKVSKACSARQVSSRRTSQSQSLVGKPYFSLYRPSLTPRWAREAWNRHSSTLELYHWRLLGY